VLRSSRARACFVTADIAEALAGGVSRGDAGGAHRCPGRTTRCSHRAFALVSRRLTDDAWIFFTSGTTGRCERGAALDGSLLAMTAAYYADVSAISLRDSSFTSPR